MNILCIDKSSDNRCLKMLAPFEGDKAQSQIGSIQTYNLHSLPNKRDDKFRLSLVLRHGKDRCPSEFAGRRDCLYLVFSGDGLSQFLRPEEIPIPRPIYSSGFLTEDEALELLQYITDLKENDWDREGIDLPDFLHTITYSKEDEAKLELLSRLSHPSQIQNYKTIKLPPSLARYQDCFTDFIKSVDTLGPEPNFRSYLELLEKLKTCLNKP